MDIQKKLKLVFWISMLIIWGSFAYGFLKKGKLKKIAEIENPFEDINLAEMLPESTPPAETPRSFGELPEIPLARHLAPTPERNTRLSDYHTTGEHKEIAEKLTKETKVIWNDPPPGYAIKDDRSFLIYKEIPPVLEQFLVMLGYLRGNLMLDLVIFSPWKRTSKVLLYLFDNKASYHALTRRPAWSYGTSDLLNRTIYVINGFNTLGITAHELSHIYFDSFFNKSVPCPLWLSEGVAVFMQTERAKQKPDWLKQTLEYIKNGGGFKLEKLMSYQNLGDMEVEEVKLWYAQSYSVVRFLMKFNNLDTFYQFSKSLRDGHSVTGSLYLAYNKPFDKISSLEYAWHYDLKTNKITGID